MAVAVEAVFAGLPVADFAAAHPFYERLFGYPADMLPHEHEAAWQLEGSAWVYVVQDAERAGRGLLTVLVSDLDGQLAHLGEQGIDASPVETVPGKFSRSSVTDADGNRITFARPG